MQIITEAKFRGRDRNGIQCKVKGLSYEQTEGKVHGTMPMSSTFCRKICSDYFCVSQSLQLRVRSRERMLRFEEREGSVKSSSRSSEGVRTGNTEDHLAL